MSDINASLRFWDGRRIPGVDQFWRCPKCDFSMGCGSPAKLSPPQCPIHRVECEQVAEDGFYAGSDPRPERRTGC